MNYTGVYSIDRGCELLGSSRLVGRIPRPVLTTALVCPCVVHRLGGKVFLTILQLAGHCDLPCNDSVPGSNDTGLLMPSAVESAGKPSGSEPMGPETLLSTTWLPR